MNKSKLILSNKKFIGTLDMEVLTNTKLELSKLNKHFTISDIFIQLSKNDMDCICSLAIQSICKCMNVEEDYIVDIFVNEENELKRFINLQSIYEYINDLLEKCMPPNKKKEDSIFVDIPEYNTKDWDLPYMQYLWETTMNKKNSFWDVTPKAFFEQIEVFKVVNDIKEEEVEWM